jgi:aspartyl-tRNA(Asn)/glutamyl-tRNA(Gln) amidotransferase subunit C
MPETPGSSTSPSERVTRGSSRSRSDRVEISRDEVAHLANLARIDLSDDELDHLAPQLTVILESVASISGIAGDDVPPTSHPLPLTNVFREDVVRPGLTAEQALSGAPAQEQQRFSVPRILGDEQ